MKEDRQFIQHVKRDVLFGHDIAPPIVDPEKCRGCGHCVKVCGASVFEIREQKAQVAHGERCFACGHCWSVCPQQAVIQNDSFTPTKLKPGPVPAVPPDMLQLLFRERRSVRLFDDKPVSKEHLLQIIEAGRYTPTGSNRQDIRYIVLSNKEKVSELRSLVEHFMEETFEAVQNEATASILASRMGQQAIDVLRYYASAYQVAKGIKETNAYFPLPFGPALIVTHAQSFDQMASFNCSVALYNCSLMAHSLGLGSCFLGFVQIGANMDKTIKHWLRIPEENQAYGAMVVGHPGVKYLRLIERKSPETRWL